MCFLSKSISVDISLQPRHICSDFPESTPNLASLSTYRDVHYQFEFLQLPISVDILSQPLRVCLDPSVSSLRLVKCSRYLDARCQTPSLVLSMSVYTSFRPPHTCFDGPVSLLIGPWYSICKDVLRLMIALDLVALIDKYVPPHCIFLGVRGQAPTRSD